jgi:hypothetical protein
VTPTPGPTPTPTPDPWSCAGCTDTSSNCTSYCSNNDNKDCVDHCVGDKNKVCQQYCFGNDNKSCINYCWGSKNKSCVTNCRDMPYPSSAGAAQQGVSPALGVAAVLLLKPRLWWRRRGHGDDFRDGDQGPPSSCPCGG